MGDALVLLLGEELELLDGDELLLDGNELVLLLGDELVLLDEGDELLLELGEDDAAEELLLGSIALWPDEEDDDAPPPWMPRAASVCWSSWPDWLRLFCCWNCLMAAWVFGPIWPSIVPTSSPFD